MSTTSVRARSFAFLASLCLLVAVLQPAGDARAQGPGAPPANAAGDPEEAPGQSVAAGNANAPQRFCPGEPGLRNGKVPARAQDRPAGRSSQLEEALTGGAAIATTCSFVGDLVIAAGASLSGHGDDRSRLTITGDVTVLDREPDTAAEATRLQDLTIDGVLTLGDGTVLRRVTVLGDVVVSGRDVDLRDVTIAGDLTVVDGGHLRTREDVEVAGEVAPAPAASLDVVGTRTSHYRTEPVHAEIEVTLHDPALTLDEATLVVEPGIVDGVLGQLGTLEERPALLTRTGPVPAEELRRGVASRWTVTLAEDAPLGDTAITLSVRDGATELGTEVVRFDVTAAPALAVAQVSDLLVATYPQELAVHLDDAPSGVPLRLATTLTDGVGPVEGAAVTLQGTSVVTDADGRAWFGDEEGSDGAALAELRDLVIDLPAGGYVLEVALVDVATGRTAAAGTRPFEVLPAPDVTAELTAPAVVGEGQPFDLSLDIVNAGGPVPEGVTAELRLVDGAGRAASLTLDGVPVELAAEGDDLVGSVPAPSIGTDPLTVPFVAELGDLGDVTVEATLSGDATGRALASPVLDLQVAPVPNILDVTPDELTETIEADLTITAVDVAPGASVTVGGVTAEVVQREPAEDDMIVMIVRVPGSVAVGPADVAITNPNGVIGNAVGAVTVLEISRPSIDAADPGTIPELTTATLTLSGADLDPSATVTIGGFTATVLDGDAAERDRLEVEVPTTLWAGEPTITITNPDLGSTEVDGLLTVTPLPEPGAVTGVVVDGAARATFLEVTWTDATDAEHHDVRYRRVGSGDWRILDQLAASPAAVTGLTPGTAYELQVRGANRARAGAWSATVATSTAAPAGSVSFSTTGQVHRFTVPAGYDTVRVEATGAQGGDGNHVGGRAGLAAADVTVTPGETLTVRVGGRGTDKQSSSTAPGGYNGGGTGGSGCGGLGGDGGAGGGGASDVRRGSTRLLVAAGGGGAGTVNVGGSGGGLNGANGSAAGEPASAAGRGATQTTAGAAGTAGRNGTAGNGATGGTGAACYRNWVGYAYGGGGGGGGGWFGGGGAGTRAGGGGGSSYVAHAGNSGRRTQSGVGTGDGLVTISWTAVAPPSQGTAPRTAVPRVISALGDSISQGTGATGDGQGGNPGASRPRNSWSTGDWPALASQYQRLAQLTAGTRAENRSANGARMALDVVGQARSLPADVDYVTVQMGGNDLCRPTVEDMTPVSVYEQQFASAMAWIDDNRPDALVSVSAVPDIYRLWEVRRSNWIAVAFWALGIIPCQSLLSSPTSTSPDTMARRDQVRQRGLEYNDALERVCAQYLRCRYDAGEVWNFTNDPASFVSGDISSQDHFHPSFQGQQKLAAVSWGATFDFTNAAPPTVTTQVTGAQVQVSATGAAPIAGLEVRYHTGEDVGAWQEVLASSTTVVPPAGTTTVEVRAVDRDGNVSGSTLVPVGD